MLQKLENIYLAILRFVVIAVAGVLLVAVALLGFNSFKAIQLEPTAKEVVPQVEAKTLIDAITEKPLLEANAPAIENTLAIETDPNMIFYARSASAVVVFVSQRGESVQKEEVFNIAKRRANSFEAPRLVSAFAQGLADSMEKTLADPAVIRTAQSISALDIVNKALNIYTENFNAQIKAAEVEQEAKQQEYVEKKAEGIKSLYIAAGAFAAFLAIVFLSIIIRIERNLRHLENKTKN